MMENNLHTLVLMILVFVVPYGCALAFGAATEKFGNIAQGVGSIVGLAAGIYVFSIIATALS